MSNNSKGILASVGPAIVVAAVVLGPGSIMTSSKVGATLGFTPLVVLAGAVILMIGMVALAMRIGVSYQHSPCEEIANRLGRWVAVTIGLVVFVLVAFYQASNNMAIIGGLTPLFQETPNPWISIAILLALNGVVVACLYLARNLYRTVESMMKILIGLIVVAFLVNFIVVLAAGSTGAERNPPRDSRDLLPLLGMIGTTFSIAGAFYQAYLVKEKGWTLSNVKEGMTDSIVSISVLGCVTAVILMTSAIVFYGRIEPGSLNSVEDVANQLKPLFGPAAKYVFCIGILAGAISSFMINAMIGGAVLADSLGKGGRMADPWTRHLTTLALAIGFILGCVGILKGKDSIVYFITLAQALTVLGMPALAAAMVYLATRKDLSGEKSIPWWLLALAVISLVVAVVLALRLGDAVWNKIAALPLPPSLAC